MIVRPVETTEEKTVFLRLPETLYTGDPNWVCPLRIERRDFFETVTDVDNADARLR